MFLDRLFKKKLNTYNSCKVIPMFNFYEILETNDYRWLIKGFDNEDLKVSKDNEIHLSQLFETLFEEYVTLQDDKQVIRNLKQKALILKLQKRLLFGGSLIKLITQNPKTRNLDKIIEELRTWKFYINKEKDISKELERILKQFKGLRTRINLETSKYEKSLENNKNKRKSTLDEQTTNVEKVLDLKYAIDQRTTTVSKWISYCKKAEKIVKENGKRKN